MLTRRQVLGAAGVALVGPAVWARHLSASPRAAGASSELSPPDQFGVRLRPGFRSRVLARSDSLVSGTDYVWHGLPDGGAVFAAANGGWVYVSNSEKPDGAGGVSTLVFDASGAVVDAQSILVGTTRNCSGGPTPWGTWLSCEEVDFGGVYECDPFVPGSGRFRPGLGAFRHEAAAVDAVTGDVYLTEDERDGRLYRFSADEFGDLRSGQLFAARLPVASARIRPGDAIEVAWEPVAFDAPERSDSTTSFDGGEGAWMDGRRMLFTTKGDCRVWVLDVVEQRLTVLHDCLLSPDTSLDDVDNIVVHQGSGDVYIAEDSGNMELAVLRERADGSIEIDAFLQLVGQDNSEIAGPAFSPDGQRLYFASQRGSDGRGLIYEVTGPFPRPRPGLVSNRDLEQADRLGR